MPLTDIVAAALLHGLGLSLALGALIVGSLWLDAEMWVGDYPQDIREAFGPMSSEARRRRVPVALLLGAVLLGALVLGLGWLFGTAPGSPGFLAVFLYVFTLITTFNLVDLVILDWLLFVRIRPSFIVLPGTEGMAGYEDDAFHLRAFLVGLAGTVALSLVIAGGAAALIG